MKISVLAFDLCDNATGRADLLARLLAPRYAVEVVGPVFGTTRWRPAASSPISYRAVVGGRYPPFAAAIPALLREIDGDLIYASKPRPTSFGLALLKRLGTRRPVLLDIDDWEVGLFYRSSGWGRLGRVLNVSNPNGLPWTWLMERLTPLAQGITVASRFLQQRFGGTLIPHVRDVEAWRPDAYDGRTARRSLGARDDEQIVMFLGTPRAYKGLDDLIEAVRRLARPRVLLALVGAGSRYAGIPGVRTTDQIAFDDVPRYLAAADVVAIPQRASCATAGQVPAKLFDAMALGRPIVSTRVSMVPEILEGCGVVVAPGDPAELAGALQRMLDDPAMAAELGRRARARCVADYSFAVARTRLFPQIDDLLASGSSIAPPRRSDVLTPGR
jgi:glycosyltransferase involved in cell wall biosynthesis